MVDVRVLGPIDVVSDVGEVVPVSGLRPKALLAYLALALPNGVASDRIIEDVWFDDPPTSMDTTLQVTVSRLRKAIGSDLVTTTADGYQLELPASNTDLHRFRTHCRRGRQLQTLGRFGAAAEAFRQGLAEWRGAALGDLRQIEFAERTATVLEEERIAAVEDLLAAQISAGDHRLVVGELSGLSGSFPYRERLWELLMLALYRSGRQADALRAFQDARAALAENLGVVPGPALTELEEQILQHDPALASAEEPARVWDPSTSEIVEYPAGAIVVDEGEPADTVYWIEDGLVEVSTIGPEGERSVIAELGQGRYFGELAALLGSRRTATVTAVKPTRLTVLDVESFRARLAEQRGD